ncbi:hypothetical protein AB0L75_42545 [Streptomyces sp. NPDC052101]|uniref:hypothetical protein n=1 Tax=Streptomyces sp. NPDC052101 TaxID=3155763 RepID=UPI00342E8D10
MLDVAAADVAAGVPLAERTRRFGLLVGVDSRLHGRLLAGHLAHRPLAAGGLGEQEWWEQALALVPQLVAAAPAPETARLVELVLGAWPPEHAAQLEAKVR